MKRWTMLRRAMELITDITLELTGDERLYMASAKQGDKRTRFIRIALTNNGKEINPVRIMDSLIQ